MRCGGSAGDSHVTVNWGILDRTIVEHWDGTGWKVVHSPNPGGRGEDNDLRGVVAVSPDDGQTWATHTIDDGHTRYFNSGGPSIGIGSSNNCLRSAGVAEEVTGEVSSRAACSLISRVTL